MARKEPGKQGTKGPKKKKVQPQTTRRAPVQKTVAKKKAPPKKVPSKKVALKAAVKKAPPKKVPSKKVAPKAAAKKAKRATPSPKIASQEWLEAFSFGLALGHLQEFFRWCWENIDEEKTRDIIVGLYRTIFFPFESMPVHEPLPVWRQRQVLGFLKSLKSPNAAALEKIIKQWAQETDRDLDMLGGGR